MGEFINFVIKMVVLVIGGTMAFATFFVAQGEKKRINSENEG